ncbi:type II CRISPR RNA-guided endonuclease Cas9 [Algoriphagus hitonicola]|uniref:CRISPR-associated endonuclease Cas9 n=1 Tax=Algoriphagus hitonicola TaxID=435880 RepID=A0A1I2VQA1_9BACT|nr:type II CRISPR RNA-guided endonuclease Cas9 [Algoriphagus hitonicola]SFG91408.1 CRISPR-associated endonuclease Csn1 [Algoriphagus hitonicola]
MKKILGLDLGTNSIGWALIEQDFKEREGRILGMGSRIIPMSQDILGEFEKGNSISQTAERTRLRGVRRLRERHLLRRERLLRVLNVLNFLPKHFSDQIDFEKNLGKFIEESEPKIAYNTEGFIFKNSFEEMLNEFKSSHPELVKGGRKIPYDWTIYFLRKKAITEKVEKEELAWLILNFNQKRGYYQLRGEEDDEKANKLEEFYSLKVIEITADESPNKKGETWYSLILENGWVYRRSSKVPMDDWLGKTKDFIVTTDIDEEGNVKLDKEGNEKRSFRAPSEDDWGLRKKKTEKEIKDSNKTVGEFIYDNLLSNPSQKIKGDLIRTIERKFYKKELKSILISQKRFHSELNDEGVLSDCIRELYKNNYSHQSLLQNQDLIHLLVEDIIFYQRPLRSQKSTISNCPLESRVFMKDGIENVSPIKVVSKSHPLYQEFRLLQWINNLRIIGIKDEKYVTEKFLGDIDQYEELLDFLMNQKEIDCKNLMKFFLIKEGLKGKELNSEILNYKWNYVYDVEKGESKVYPCNPTRFEILKRLEKVEGFDFKNFTSEFEEALWHVIYSVTDKVEFEKALKSFARKKDLDVQSFVDSFKKIPPYKSDYGAYSLKAIKRLIPLMRFGSNWSAEKIELSTLERIDKILNGEYDPEIKDKVRDLSKEFTSVEDFQGLPIWFVNYLVYGRHSEASEITKWNSSEGLESFIKGFKQHSLRNPIVEQVIVETLRVVKDIWLQYGNGNKDFFDEIHVELGRDMKNPAGERERLSKVISENESTNLRVKALLVELLEDPDVDNVRPFSPMQQEILKIYEEGILKSSIDVPDEILKISKTAQPSRSDLQRYKLWLEQKYMSPYTGKVIPLNKLFTSAYEIEHVIPQSRFFDDSLSNKVICESAVNKLKDKMMGLEFIKNFHGQRVSLGMGEEVEIFSESAFKSFVQDNYSKNPAKKRKLLMDELPEKMVERQMNDTKYISKYVTSILSNIVRSNQDDSGFNSKNVIPGNGKITNELKNDWGLNDIWNDLILPRFERMNQITASNSFTSWNKKHQKFLPTVPIEYSKGFQKKRIDHRHHALDALVIACATRDHVNYLNNEHALGKKYRGKEEKQQRRFDLKHKLCYKKTNSNNAKDFDWVFHKPWESFTSDAKENLGKITVSFKQNLRVINRTTNKYQSYYDEEGNIRKDKNGNPIKGLTAQIKGDSWAIRKAIHKDTVSGLVELRKVKTVPLRLALDIHSDLLDKKLKKKIVELKNLNYDNKLLLKYFKDRGFKFEEKDISKVDVYFFDKDLAASRVSLDTSFSEKKLHSVTDTGIQKILLNHLENYKGVKNDKGEVIDPETLAFTPEGIEEMNNNIISLNRGKFHKPIYKVRTYEPKGNKFPVGYIGNKKSKFVEAAKGTNLFFGIYVNDEGKRSYETIPFNIVMERLKQGEEPVPPLNEKEDRLLFYLSPNDLVYVPDKEESIDTIDFNNLSKNQVCRIYKMVSCTGPECHFVRADIAALIKNYDSKSKIGELGSLNKQELTIESDKRIKECCIKIKVNRLGKINK